MSARGDQKPCIYTGCSGTMQFGRETTRDHSGLQGWTCSATASHFHRPLANRAAAQPTTKATSAGADQDGSGPAK